MANDDRRRALRQIGWGMLAASGGTTGVASASLLVPRLHDRAGAEIVVGRPDEFRVAEVSDRFARTHRLYVIREVDHIHALSSVCTHLGCITRWQASQDRFKCFCHGSSFGRDGDPIEGPAPRPLERLQITLTPSAQIVVNTAVRFRKERGEWDREDARLVYPPGGKET